MDNNHQLATAWSGSGIHLRPSHRNPSASGGYIGSTRPPERLLEVEEKTSEPVSNSTRDLSTLNRSFSEAFFAPLQRSLSPASTLVIEAPNTSPSTVQSIISSTTSSSIPHISTSQASKSSYSSQRISLAFSQLDSTSSFPLGPSSQSTNPFSSRLPSVSNPISSENCITTPLPSLDVPFPQRVLSPPRRRSLNLKFPVITDRRGRGPPSKRWRLYCFRRVFVIEPNIPRLGIRYNAGQNLSLINMDRPKEVEKPEEKEEDKASSASSTELPQLIIFRDSGDVAEVPNSTHQLYKTFGPLQHLFLIDCLIGQINIADAKFLAVAAESEAVSGMCLSSLSTSPSPSRQGELDAYIYRIHRAWLIPFHLSLDNLNLRPSTTPCVPRGAAMGLYYDEASFRTKRSSRRSKPRRAHKQRSGSDPLRDVNGIQTVGDKEKERSPRELNLEAGKYIAYPDTLRSVIEREHQSKIEESHSSPNLESMNEPVKLKQSKTLTTTAALPVSNVGWDFNGFGDSHFNNLLGEKLAGYKQGIEKLLASSFYYSYEIEITQTLQRKRQMGLSFAPQGWPCGLIIEGNKNASSSKYATKNRSCSDLPKTTASENLIDGFLETNESENPQGERSSSNFSSASSCSRTIQSPCYMEIADKRFLWNSHLYYPFSAWSIDPRWFTPIMQGSVTSATLTSGIHGLDLILICRRSCHRAGTRYNHRGLDDEGNVANFNESEQLVSACRVDPSTGTVIDRGSGIAGGGWASFVQIRGSVPVFWEQSSTIAINPTPQLTRELDFARKAFSAHQKELSDLYGSVTYVNLLSGRGGETKLSKALDQIIAAHVRKIEKGSSGSSLVGSPRSALSQRTAQSTMTTSSTASSGCGNVRDADASSVRHVQWDFHQQIKTYGFEYSLSEFVRTLSGDLQQFGYYCDKPHFGSGYQYQRGIIRTNCLDCLDRTNAFQWFLCWSWLVHYLQQRGLKSFLTCGYRVTELATSQPGSGFTNSSSRFQSDSLTHSIKQEDIPITMTRQHRRGVVVGHTAPPSEPASNVHIRHRRSRTRSSIVSIENSKNHDGPASERATIKLSAVRPLVVRCFGGDDGAMTFIYRTGGVPRQPLNPKVTGTAYGNQIMALSAMGLPRPLGLELNSEQGEQEIGGEFFPNILKDVVARMWADHGDHISRAYTGTGSVFSGLLRQGKSSLATNMGHVMTSLGRLYQNTFEDAARQDAIELLLNQHEKLSLPYITKVAEKSPVSQQPKTSIKELEDTIPPLKSTIPIAMPGSEKTATDAADATAQSTGSLRVWYGSWNLGGRRVTEPLENWLMPEDSELPSADLYVIAIQELVELTGMRILLSQNDRDKEWQLELNIRHALGPSFQMLRSHSLVGLYMAVFVRSNIKNLVSQVHISEVKLGFKGQMGNKGAVLMRLRVGLTSFCFVNVHLSPGPDKSQQRRSQLQAVLNTSIQGRGSYIARDHDCLLIGGDFNFRCDVEPQQAEMWLERGLWRNLLYYDQFETCKRLLVPPFKELHESPIHFLPTYKFRRGTNLYDRGRTPAWCDRIFHSGEYTKCAVTRNWIRCNTYNRLDGFLSSDHKPVYGIFQVAIRFDQSLPTRQLPLSSTVESSKLNLATNRSTDEHEYGSWIIAGDSTSQYLHSQDEDEDDNSAMISPFDEDNEIVKESLNTVASTTGQQSLQSPSPSLLDDANEWKPKQKGNSVNEKTVENVNNAIATFSTTAMTSVKMDPLAKLQHDEIFKSKNSQLISSSATLSTSIGAHSSSTTESLLPTKQNETLLSRDQAHSSYVPSNSQQFWANQQQLRFTDNNSLNDLEHQFHQITQQQQHANHILQTSIDNQRLEDHVVCPPSSLTSENQEIPSETSTSLLN